MAEISKIKVLDGTEYDIKDATARTALGGNTVATSVPSGAVFTDHIVTISSTQPSTANAGDVWFKIST